MNKKNPICVSASPNNFFFLVVQSFPVWLYMARVLWNVPSFCVSKKQCDWFSSYSCAHIEWPRTSLFLSRLKWEDIDHLVFLSGNTTHGSVYNAGSSWSFGKCHMGSSQVPRATACLQPTIHHVSVNHRNVTQNTTACLLFGSVSVNAAFLTVCAVSWRRIQELKPNNRQVWENSFNPLQSIFIKQGEKCNIPYRSWEGSMT